MNDQIKSKKCQSSFYRLDGNGGAIKILEEDVCLGNSIIWARLNSSDVNSFLKKHLPQTPEFIFNLLCAKETRPRAMSYKDTLLAIFRGVNLNHKASPEDMVSIRLMIQKNFIITVQNRNLVSAQEVLNSLEQGTGPEDIADFLESLLVFLTDTTSDVIVNFDDVLDSIEDEFSSNSMNGMKYDRSKLNDLRRRIVVMRRYLVPQRDAINRIPIDKLSWLHETNLMHLREISDSYTRIIEDLNAAHERATIIHEELFARLQENMNQKMYLLSIVALIFMPLSFVTGLLGVNVGGIPGTDFKYAFLILCALMLGIFACQLLYLRIKKWL